MLAGGYLIIGPSLRRASPQPDLTNLIYFHAGFLLVTYITLHCHPLKWASLSPSPAWSRLHLHLIMKRLLLYLLVLRFRTPSGVFTITCIISPCARGVYSEPTWPRDHSTGSCVKGWGVIIANCSWGNQITWDGIYFPITVKEGSTCCRPPLIFCRTLPSCCYVHGLSVMAFSKTARNSLWLAWSGTAPW